MKGWTGPSRQCAACWDTGNAPAWALLVFGGKRGLVFLSPDSRHLILSVTHCLNYSHAWGIIWDLFAKELAKGGMTDVCTTLKGVGEGIGNENA